MHSSERVKCRYFSREITTGLRMFKVKCRRGLSDIPQYINQHAQTRPTTLSTTTFIRLQSESLCFGELSLTEGGPVDRTRMTEENVPNWWAPPHCCLILRQWVEHSLSWQNVNKQLKKELPALDRRHTNNTGRNNRDLNRRR